MAARPRQKASNTLFATVREYILDIIILSGMMQWPEWSKTE